MNDQYEKNTRYGFGRWMERVDDTVQHSVGCSVYELNISSVDWDGVFVTGYEQGYGYGRMAEQAMKAGKEKV